MNLRFEIYLPMHEEFLDFLLVNACEISKIDIYVKQSRSHTNDNER
jgi:hypothetical protein